MLGGFGVMQATDAAERSCENLWNWRANVRAGRRIFATKVSEVSGTHLDEDRPGRGNSLLAQCLAASQQVWAAIATPLVGGQLIFEAIRRNNGGRQYRWFITNADGSDNLGPYTAASDCGHGEWRRHLSLNLRPQYVPSICNCETAMAGVTCPVEVP